MGLYIIKINVMKKGILALLILFLVSGLYAQNDYYWYNGEQIFVVDFPYKKVLEVDTTIVNSVELEGVLNNPNISVIDFKDLAFLDYMNQIYDSTFFDKRYAVIESEDSISEEAINNTAIKYIGPFIDPPIGDLMGVSNIFLVVLNSAEEFNVLDSLAAEYHLIIIGDSDIEPDRLFYLYCTGDTGMSGLEMANVFYEFGIFQDSEGYYIFDTNPLGLFDIKKSEIEASISIYPNPASEFIYYNSKDKNIKIEQVEFYNMQGVKLLSENNQLGLEISRFPKGFYNLLINTNVGHITFPIILN